MATDSRVLFHLYKKFLKVSPLRSEKLLKTYLKYPKMTYTALIKYGISQCLQGMSLQTARNSCMKAAVLGTFVVLKDKDATR